MKKILIVTYYWPPAGGIAVQRVVKFCKYLPSYGWEPIILTVENGNYENIDNSIGNDVAGINKVYKARSLEPHSIYNAIQKFFGGKVRKNEPGPGGNNEKPSTISKLADLIRLNIFIPDARIGWLSAAHKEGIKIIENEKPDIILSTAPPYTAHLIARKLKKDTNLPWIADYRDPWLENINYNTVPRLALVKYLNRRLEQKVLNQADQITVVGPKFCELYIKKLPKNRHHNCHVIPNGFDMDDIVEPENTNGNKFYITYFGTTYPAVFQDAFFSAINILNKKDQALQHDLILRFVGKITPGFKSAIKQLVPDTNTEYIDHLPIKNAIQLLYQPQLLVLFIGEVPHNEIIITGKLFDYLPTKNPILAIGPTDGDAGNILDITHAGKIFGYDAISQIADYIYDNYKKWQSGNLRHDSHNLEQFTREQATKDLANLLNDTVDNKATNYSH
jgi:glycosyltransferase involved in cell wall biosynthesis